MDLYAALRARFGYDTFNPGQEEVITRVLAGEDTLAILATGAGVSNQAVWVSVGRRSEGDPLRWTLGSLPILLFPPLAFVAGGCSLLAGSGGGLYWVLAATVLTFVAASLNAWVLLVEILR